jgi:N-acyl-D-aspartate/D-glutamate deacylase
MADAQPVGPPAFDRRKLLVVGGFVATNVLLSRAIGASPRSGSPGTTQVVVGDERAAPAVPAEPAVLDADAEVTEPDHTFDLVVLGGRVMDPASGYDAVANVGIDADRVTAITESPLLGRQTIRADGLVVAPGFIDLLSYEPNDFGSWFKIGDGVTTNLGMHGINDTAEHFFTRYGVAEPVPPVNYGGAFDHSYMRHDQNGFPKQELTSSQLDTLTGQLAEAIDAGWIGLNVEPEYTPWVPTEEITRLAQVCADKGVPIFWHARYSDPEEPGTNAEAVAEVLQVARETGAATHIEHLTSTGGTYTMDETLATLEDARTEGMDLTACLYPYDFWATTLGSERFAPGWQERFRISYDDLEVPGTGERLTEATFASYQARNTLVAAHAIPEGDVEAALRTSWIMLGSDAILDPPRANGRPNNHPRAAGTFARTLGVYARERGVVALMDALAKCTILPARRLEARAPALRRKGRLQIGADADLTLFDAGTVIDEADITNPAQMSSGVEYVVVAGKVVRSPDHDDDDGMDRDVRPGVGITYG